MDARSVSLLSRASSRLSQRLAAWSPARRSAERSVSAPVASVPLVETGETMERYFLPGTPPRACVVPDDIPDVTVVVPVYNSEAWLDDCLSSVLAQTNVELEVVCVDDGSTDNSLRLLERYARGEPRVRVVGQANSGQSVARNTGLDAARGRYLVYLDSDDFWRDDGLAALVREADRKELDVVLFDGVAFRDGDVPEGTWNWYSTYYPRARRYRRVRSGARMITDMRRRGDYRPHVGMYLSRTEFVREAGLRFIPGIVHQDNPYTFALLAKARHVEHIKRYFYARRLRPGSTITALRTAISARGYFLSCVAMRRELRLHAFDGPTMRGLEGVVQGVFESACKRFAALPDSVQAELGTLDDEPDARAVYRAIRAQSAKER